MNGFSTDILIKHVRFFFRVWATQQNSFRCRHKLCIREVWKLLPVTWHTSCSITIIQWSKQWTCGGLHKIFEKNHAKCYETYVHIYMSLLQIRSMPISPGLPILATLLFNRKAKGILPRLSRSPILCDNDNVTELINTQPQLNDNRDTHRSIYFIPTGSTAAVQWEDVKSHPITDKRLISWDGRPLFPATQAQTF